MVTTFNSANTGSAQAVGTAPPGSILKIWGFFPFWIGKSRGSLETATPNFTTANLEVRDGMYIFNDASLSGVIKPVVIPWAGPIYLLNNGTLPKESVDNVVIWEIESPCG